MASRVEVFDVTVPALTLQSAPFVAAMPFDIGIVEAVEIIVPAGPSGLVGLGILHSGESVFPREPARWIITDDEKIHWPLDSAPTAGRWGARMYNQDVFPHTYHFRWLVHEIPVTVSLPALVPIG